jgi:lipopolysaccharide biosynthesis glycosyltransferase
MNNNKYISVQHLEYKYNCPSMVSNYLVKNSFLEENLIIIHFTLLPKPWNFIDFNDGVFINKYYSDFEKYLFEWIKIYNEMVLDNASNVFNNKIYVNLNNVYLISPSHDKLIDNEHKF